VLTLGPDTAGSFPAIHRRREPAVPAPIIAGGIAGGLLSAVAGAIALRRLRSDYQAMVFLVISLIATAVVTNDVGLFNGPAGLSIIPQPLSTALNLSLVGYRWFLRRADRRHLPDRLRVRAADHQRPARPFVSCRTRPRAGRRSAGQERNRPAHDLVRHRAA